MIHSDNAPNSFKIYDDDKFIVSYPRSGQTWLRSLIAHVAFSNKAWMMSHVDTMIPDFRRTTRIQRQYMPRPRLLKSHEYYNERFPTVLYLIRDPRAVAYSQWNWRSRMNDSSPWKYYGDFDMEFINHFIEGEIFPGSWDKHVNSWTGWSIIMTKAVIVLKYEDLFTDSTIALQNVCEYLNIEWDRTKIDNAFDDFPAGKATHFLKSSIKPLGANPDEWKMHMTYDMKKTIEINYYPIMDMFDYV